MEEIIKEINLLCQTYNYTPEQAMTLVKVEVLRQIGNSMETIQSNLSELLEIVREQVAAKNAVEDFELNRMMEAWGTISGKK